ncbi:MAG: GIY-YIG nuclease family protein [Planctomycetes bacterium]|nr:GIY-YIG nuclease family protein [Planctomycetota bacterium]
MSDSAAWHVYVLTSERAERTYVGIALDPQKRLQEHNGIRVGGARSTRAYRPWKLAATYGPFDNRSEACIAEARVKKLKGKGRLQWVVSTLMLLLALSLPLAKLPGQPTPTASRIALDSVDQDPSLARGNSQFFQWQAPSGNAELARSMTAEADGILQQAHQWLGLHAIPGMKAQPRSGKMIWVATREDIEKYLKQPVPQWAAAVAVPSRGEILLSVQAAGDVYRLRSTLRHELVHHALGAIGADAFQSLPAWFHEGLAEQFSGEIYLSDSGISLSWMAISGNLHWLSEFDESFGHSGLHAAEGYAQGHAFVAMLVEDYGDVIIGQILKEVSDGAKLEHALIRTTGQSLVALEEVMRKRLGGFRTLARDFYQHLFSFLFVLASFLLPFVWWRKRKRRLKMEAKWIEQDDAAREAEVGQVHLIKLTESEQEPR